jgi:hypothetical protein
MYRIINFLEKHNHCEGKSDVKLVLDKKESTLKMSCPLCGDHAEIKYDRRRIK